VTTDALPAHRLTARELSVWRTFLRAYAIISSRLEHDLVNANDLPLAWYEVLLHLAEASEDHRSVSTNRERSRSPTSSTRQVR